MTFIKWSCKLKKTMKNDEKKCHLKNYKVEHVLLYHFLNDENHTQIVSPGKKKLILPHVNGSSFYCTYIYVYWMQKIFVGVESRIFVFVLAMSSWISATKNLTKVLWCRA